MTKRKPESCFARVPNNVALDPRLSDGAVRLFTVLAAYCGAKDHCWPAQATLCAVTNTKQRAISNWLKELRAFHYVRIVQQGPGKPARYYLCQPLPSTSVLPKPSTSVLPEREQQTSRPGQPNLKRPVLHPPLPIPDPVPGSPVSSWKHRKAILADEARRRTPTTEAAQAAKNPANK